MVDSGNAQPGANEGGPRGAGEVTCDGPTLHVSVERGRCPFTGVEGWCGRVRTDPRVTRGLTLFLTHRPTWRAARDAAVSAGLCAIRLHGGGLLSPQPMSDPERKA